MPDRLTCDEVSARDLVERYVSRRVTEDESEAFELHVLECDSCAADLKAAVEARAAFMHRGADAVASTPLRARRSWLPGLAVAAVLLLAVGGVWEWSRRHEPPSVTRGPGEPLSLAIEWTPGGSLKLSWAPQPGAVTYRVQVSSAAAEPVFEQVSVPSVTIEAAVMAHLREPTVEVEAQDGTGGVVARSGVTPIPIR